MFPGNRDDMIYSLERTHAIRVLLTLRDAEIGGRRLNKKILTQLITTSTQGVKSRVDELSAAGLVTVEQDTAHPFPQWVSLTPLGREVAEHLQAIEELMQRR
jgi:DNA-binding HxlR family transcriptional regulator